MLRKTVLTGLALGVIMAMSSADWTATDVAQEPTAGPTLSADLGAFKEQGPYLHVEARFLRAQSGEPVKVLPIVLREGEQAAFSVPGYPEQTFRFERSGDAVVVTVNRGRSILARLLG
ncbi:MAG: hypothetical protein AAGH68_16775 [Pseudomonadota bacterium]